jgi:DNA replication protein DnaC
LKGVDERIEEHLAWAQREKASGLELIERVLGEAAGRARESRIERRISASGLKVRKTLEAFDWPFQPKLDRSVIEELGRLAFIEGHEDVIFTGKSGTGKSHILQAIALRACERELTVHYARCVDLLDDLYAGLADGSYDRRMRRWCRGDLLVLDDVGLGQVKKHADEPTAAQMLFYLIDRRHTRASTAITSNIKLSAWGKYLGDAALTMAILDRLAATAIRIDIDGPSYRQHLARQRARRQLQMRLSDN